MSLEQAKALLRNSVSRPTLYSVRFPRGRGRSGRYQTGIDDFSNAYLQFYCKATALPETRVETVAALGHENMGVNRNQPTAVLFGKPMTIEVIENSDFKIYRQMKQWVNSVALNANPSSTSGSRTQRMTYYKDFVSDMYMSKLEYPNDYEVPDRSNRSLVNAGYREVIRFNFVNAYPIRVGEISLGSDRNNDYVTFNVDFTYETYEVTGGLDILVRSTAGVVNV